MSSARLALLIGINHYPLITQADLKGCVNDLELMRSLLEARFGFPSERIRTLCNGEATQAGIRAALSALLGDVGKDDIVVLFYAGHGSRVLDPRQLGRFIESIVPSDSGRGQWPNRDIFDEEIDQWVQRVNEKTPYVTLIFDCCHSGSVTRDAFGEATREVPPDLRSPAEMFGGEGLPEVFSAPPALDEPDRNGIAGWLPGRRRAVVIAACQADELANEHKALAGEAALQVVRHGALTYFLGQTLERARAGTTWRDVFEQLAPVLTARYGRQHPLLEGKLDEMLFGAEESKPSPYLQVLAASTNTVELGGGAAHGLRVGSLWTVRTVGAAHREAGDQVAIVEVHTVRAATSTAHVVPSPEPEPGSLAPGMRAFLLRQTWPAPGLRVAVGGSTPGEPRQRLIQALGNAPLLNLVEEEADVLIRCLEPRQTVRPEDPCPGVGPLADWTWAAVGGDGRLFVRLRPDRSEGIQGLLDDLTSAACYRQLLELNNPDPSSPLQGRVSLRLKRWDPHHKVFADAAPETGIGLPVFREGEKAEVEIVNHHESAVWVSLVHFGCDGKIELLMPRPGHATYSPGGIRIGPGDENRLSITAYYRQDPRFAAGVVEGLPMHLPAGFPWAAEPVGKVDFALITLKLFVTAASADFEFLEQQSGTRAGYTVGHHPLEQVAWLYAPRDGTRSILPVQQEIAPEMDWTTVNLPIGARRAAT